ncbi:MAG: hypothetical protein WAW12_13995 [Pseudomonas sp.]
MEYSERPTRGRQAAPTKPEVNDALFGIREAAITGNVLAMAALAFIAKFDEQAETLRSLRDDLRDLSLTVQADSRRHRSAQINNDLKGTCDKVKADIFAAIDKVAEA